MLKTKQQFTAFIFGIFLFTGVVLPVTTYAQASENCTLIGATEGPCYAVASTETLTLIGTGTKLVLLDYTDPGQPQILSSMTTPGIINSIVIDGSMAYVADREAGLRIIDISDPQSPQEVGFFDTGSVFDLAVNGSIAYVADYDYGLRVIDVSDPSNPQELGFYDTPGVAVSVDVSDNIAYIADEEAGIRVIDVSNLSNPQELGFYNTLDNAYDIVLSGNKAFVADHEAGLRVIDVTDPFDLQEIGFYDSPGEAFGVAVSDNIVYVADIFSGLLVIRYDYPVNADPISLEGPSHFTLLQNYPNPFNPTTIISFSLNIENTEDAELIIYNIKG